MGISDIITLLGGVALFLFGMTLMGDGLKKAAGNKLELILYRLSGTPLRGLLLGTGVTAVVQSSSATSVMVVGFVNSGMMKVRNSIYVILGAILGTSVTGWVICLSYIEGGGSLKALLSTATLTGIVAVVGIILRMFLKGRTQRNVGDILMGFAVLMFGMSAMSSAVSGLGEATWFRGLLTTLSNPVLGILVGAVFSAVLQSASAAVGIVQALSFTGAMGVSQTLPLLMGISIGAAVPVLLSAVGAEAEGKRAALLYPISCLVGTMVTAVVFFPLNAAFKFPFMALAVDPFRVAAINTAMRLVMMALLVPMAGLLVKFVTWLVKAPPAPEVKGPEIRLEERFLTHPALAIEQCRVAIADMAKEAKKSVSKATRLITEFTPEGFARVQELENDGDIYEDRLGTYLMELTGREMTPRQNADVTAYLHALTDFERISDHALNLAESAKEIYEKKIVFTDQAKRDLNVLSGAVHEILHVAVKAFDGDDPAAAATVEPLEQIIDDLCDDMKARHIERLRRGECAYTQGYAFNDILTNFERISDHCSNIAIADVERHESTYEAHGYARSLKTDGGEAFRKAYEAYAERFKLD